MKINDDIFVAQDSSQVVALKCICPSWTPMTREPTSAEIDAGVSVLHEDGVDDEWDDKTTRTLAKRIAKAIVNAEEKP